MDGCGWMDDGCMHTCTDGWLDGWADVWMDGLAGQWMDGRVGGQMVGWMDGLAVGGWMDLQHFQQYFSLSGRYRDDGTQEKSPHSKACLQTHCVKPEQAKEILAFD